MPASIAAPMSSVCTWQFQMPSPPTTTIESPSAAPRCLELRRSVVVGRVEEVHDLVAEVGDAAVAAGRAGVRLDRDGGVHTTSARGHRAAGDDVEARGEQQLEPAAAGVDDPGLAQHRQQVGGAARRPSRAAAAARSSTPLERGLAARRPPARPTRRPIAHHGEDRALDRAEHRLVGGVGRAPQAGGDVGAPRPTSSGAKVSARPRRICERITPELPAGAHERAVADGLADLAPSARAVGRAVELADHRLERERHVGAGVAVGHRVDVEAVQLVLVGAQRVAVGRHDPPQVGRRRAVCRTVTAGMVLRPLLSSTVPSPVRSPVASQEVSVMASVCEVCGKKPQFGMRLSHSHRRTKRRWNPNVQKVRAVVNGSPKRLHVCTSCLKAGKVQKP